MVVNQVFVQIEIRSTQVTPYATWNFFEAQFLLVVVSWDASS